MNIKDINISNSLLKAYEQYRRGDGCGIVFNLKYIEKILTTPDSEAALCGKWFEFKCTGALNRDGSEPQPIMIKTGLNATCRVLEKQIDNFKNIYAGLNYEANKTILWSDGKYQFKAVLDIYMDKIIRDIKTSGLIRDKYSDFGWENLQDKPQLLSQTKMYVWLLWKITGQIYDFYFDIFSSKDENDCRTYLIKISEDYLFEFERQLYDLLSKLEFEMATLFEAKPNIIRCSGCPLKADCEFKALIPEIEIINLK